VVIAKIYVQQDCSHLSVVWYYDQWQQLSRTLAVWMLLAVEEESSSLYGSIRLPLSTKLKKTYYN